jgi:large subunit ribosomal protein L22
MRVEAIAKFVRIAPQKARLSARAVKGMPVEEAFIRLGFTSDLKRIGLAPRHSDAEIAKVIKSAAANAEHNFNLDVNDLIVERVEVDQANVLKRYRPKPRGRAGSIFKRQSHLRAWVSDESGTTKPAGRKPATPVSKATPKKKTPARKPAGHAEVAEPEAETAAPTAAPTAPKKTATKKPAAAAKPKADPKAKAAPKETTTKKPAAKKPAPKKPAAKKPSKDKE